MKYISKNIRTVLFICLLATAFQSTAQCVLSDTDATEAEVINCLINCGCLEVVIPEGVDLTMADSWDLRSEGDITFRIGGSVSRLLFTGTGNNAKQLLLSENSILIVHDVTNSSAIEASGANGKTRIYFGNTFYNGNQFPEIVAAGGATADGVLPVELIAFNAAIEQDEILLTWQTASEINHKEFMIEHSFDGRNFDILGSLPGSANPSEIQEYHFLYSTASTGTNYYRLLSVDLDGTLSYSAVISIHKDDKKSAPHLVSTLVQNFIYIKAPNRKQYNYLIVNDMGLAVQGGVSDTEQIDVSELKTGSYHLLLLNDQFYPWLRFVKIKM